MIKVPVTSAPNQSFFMTTTINNKNLSLEFFLSYRNDTYWTMDIKNRETGVMYLSNVPLLPADDPAQNVIEAFESLEIGVAYIVQTDNLVADGPDGNNLGTSWTLVWDDNLEVRDPKGGATEVILVWEDVLT